ncbi:MAG TPA: polysaccharide deacetylase family protein [Verrucomicrobiales bacterium]|nr:polysaccharide deacetylase family protein [Verrucomicrobiales bacterium]
MKTRKETLCPAPLFGVFALLLAVVPCCAQTGGRVLEGEVPAAVPSADSEAAASAEVTSDGKPVRAAYFSVEIPEPYVALTFDDGPHPKNTPRLLDLLRERKVRATFYVVGQNVKEFPLIVRRIAEEGHEIGNHTYTHPNLQRLSDTALRQELEKTRAAIKDAAGVEPLTMRPPYGSFSTRQREWTFKEFGYPAVMWSVDPLDWKRPGPSVVADRIIKGASNGAIILAHDLHAQTVDAMPKTLDGLTERGFRFVTMSQLFALENRWTRIREAEARAIQEREAAREAVEIPVPGDSGAGPASGSESSGQ